MEIILDKSTNLKRLGSTLSEDSSSSQSACQTKHVSDSFQKVDYKKSKLKKKAFPESKIQLNSTNNMSLNKNKGNTSYDSKDDTIPNAH